MQSTVTYLYRKGGGWPNNRKFIIIKIGAKVEYHITSCNNTWSVLFFINCNSRTYLIFVICFTRAKHVNYDKIHSKLPIFCIITAKYTVNCQIFALNLKKFTLAKKNLHEYIRGVRDKYEVCMGWAYSLWLS